MLTQTTLTLLAIAVGVLLLIGVMTLPLMWCFALGFGVTNAFDAPASAGLRLDVVARENASTPSR